MFIGIRLVDGLLFIRVWLVDWLMFIGIGLVDGLVGVLFGVLCLAFVGHFGDVAGLSVDNVLHNLFAVVRQHHKVIALGDVSVTRLPVSEVVVVLVLHCVVEVVLGWILVKREREKERERERERERESWG